MSATHPPVKKSFISQYDIGRFLKILELFFRKKLFYGVLIVFSIKYAKPFFRVGQYFHWFLFFIWIFQILLFAASDWAAFSGQFRSDLSNGIFFCKLKIKLIATKSKVTAWNLIFCSDANLNFGKSKKWYLDFFLNLKRNTISPKVMTKTPDAMEKPRKKADNIIKNIDFPEILKDANLRKTILKKTRK